MHKLLGSESGVVTVVLREGKGHTRRLHPPHFHRLQVQLASGVGVEGGMRVGLVREVVSQHGREAGGEGFKVSRKVGELVGEVGLEHPTFPEPLHGRTEGFVLYHFTQGAVAHLYGRGFDLEGFRSSISPDIRDG